MFHLDYSDALSVDRKSRAKLGNEGTKVVVEQGSLFHMHGWKKEQTWSMQKDGWKYLGILYLVVVRIKAKCGFPMH